jgi:hypothetical protein
VSKDKQIAMRRLPGDTLLLAQTTQALGINNTAVLRLALRYMARDLGVAFPDQNEVLICLRNLVAGCRAIEVQGLDETLQRCERLLKKHDANLKRVYKFADYPYDIERALLREEIAQKKKRSKQ